MELSIPVPVPELPNVIPAHPAVENMLPNQGGITCGAIEDPGKSSKAIDERVIINFRDKNGVIARFRDKNVVIVRFLFYR